MEASRIVRNYNDHDPEPYVISSSLSDFQESDVVAPRNVVGVLPSVPTSIQVVAVTSMTTSFSLIVSAVKKPVIAIATLNIVSGAAVGQSLTFGGVLCLPPGFAVR